MFTYGIQTLPRILLVAILSSLTSGMLHAQTTKATPKATPVPTTIPATIPRAEPVATPKKPGFFDRVFGKKPSPTPAFTPEPLPTPKTKVRNRPKSSPTPKATPEATESGNATATTTVDPTNPGLVPLPDVPLIGSPEVPGATPLPASLPPMTGDSVGTVVPTAKQPEVIIPTAKATPIPAEIRNNPMNQPIPLVDGGEALQITPGTTSPAEEREKEALRRIQFQKIKAKALEDKALQALKEKSEIAPSPAERYTALKQFYPKLFAAMRKIDGSLGVEIDEMEAASRRRLDRMEQAAPNP